jgi:hypothetical protein
MKQALSLLAGFVLIQTQAWAISGGPPESQTSSYVGTYAGVLVPKSGNADSNDEAIGMFSFSQGTNSSFTNGVFVAFVNGAGYSGTIQGVIDPRKKSMSGIMQGAGTYKDTFFDTDSATSVIFLYGLAGGSIKTKFVSDSEAPLGTSLEGVARLDVFGQFKSDGSPLVGYSAEFEVDGFQQSSQVLGADLF